MALEYTCIILERLHTHEWSQDEAFSAGNNRATADNEGWWQLLGIKRLKD